MPSPPSPDSSPPPSDDDGDDDDEDQRLGLRRRLDLLNEDANNVLEAGVFEISHLRALWAYNVFFFRWAYRTQLISV